MLFARWDAFSFWKKVGSMWLAILGQVCRRHFRWATGWASTPTDFTLQNPASLIFHTIIKKEITAPELQNSDSYF
jgi:hypothetical protein